MCSNGAVHFGVCSTRLTLLRLKRRQMSMPHNINAARLTEEVNLAPNQTGQSMAPIFDSGSILQSNYLKTCTKMCISRALCTSRARHAGDSSLKESGYSFDQFPSENRGGELISQMTRKHRFKRRPISVRKELKATDVNAAIH